MPEFDGVIVNQLDGGLGRRTPSDDGVAILVVGSGVATGSLAVNTAAKLLSYQNAVDLGIDASYDDTNSILANYHIDEFFRINPNGTLYVVLADGTFDNDALKAIIRDNTDIRMVGVVRNSADAEADFSAYIGGYQTMVNELKTEFIYVDAVIVEGNEFASETAIAAYDDLREEEAANVSVVAIQDPVIRALDAAYAKHAAVGTVLGGLTVRKVNEDLGSVNIIEKPSYAKGQSTFPLTDRGRGRWLSAVLQNGVAVSTLTPAEKTALTETGYIFVGSYAGLSGLYFNAGVNCAAIESDYSHIDKNRIWNKAARGIRLALLPRVKGNLLKTPEGKIRPTEAAELQQLGKRPLTIMETAEEISGSSIYIDPDQTVNDQNPLQVKAQLQVNGIIYEIQVDLGLTNSIA